MRDTKVTRLLLGIALVCALALIAVDYRNSSSHLISSARGAVGSIFGGAERAASSVTRPVGRFLGAGLAGASARGPQNATLQRELTMLRAELSAAQLSRSQYQQLGRMLRVSQAGRYGVVDATVIGFGQGTQQTVTLDAGSANGVAPQQTVLDGDGLVGQVVSVTSHTCTVLLASDPSSVIGVRLAPSGQIGWVTGQGRVSGGGLLRLQVLSSAATLTPGEPLVTAASVNDRPFVPGVPVGAIVKVSNRAGALTAEALVRPFANLTALDVVGIVTHPPSANPQFAVLRAPRAR